MKKRIRMTVEVEREVYEQLRRAAREEERTVSSLIRKLIKDYLRRLREGNKSS